MAKNRPGRLYKQIKSQSYTRREYMGGVPGSRIQQFDVGNASGDFDIKAHLVADTRGAIIHNSLEAIRIAANRALAKGAGAGGYHLKVRPYPHEVIRENKQASGAGADRVSQGMRQSFGKAVGTAARIENGQPILTIRVNAQHWLIAREAFRRANMKCGLPTRIEVEEGQDQIDLVLAGKIKTVKAGSVDLRTEEEKEADSEAGEAAGEAAAAPEAAEAEAPAEEEAAAEGGEEEAA